MNGNHAPDWIEASTMLREGMEEYRGQHQYSSLPKVVDDLIDYIERHSGKWLNEKTIKRDYGNRSDSKKVYRIPDWRVKIYTKWLHEEVGKDQDWITKWLEYTAYSAPGKLMAEISEPRGDIHKVYQEIKTNVPSLKRRLWGRFLGRQKEIEKLIQWADNQRYPIAVLYGFGGNGKTTIQQKVGEDFIYGVKCPLRWPYNGAVWVSAVDHPRGQPGVFDIIREIAATFELYKDYDECCQRTSLKLISPEVIQKDVKKLLEDNRVLILLDNFETVSKSNQLDILKFFGNLRGASQTLISTRYRPDWFLDEEQDEMYSMAHVLIRVDGLSSEDAERLVHEYFNAKALPKCDFDAREIKRLTTVTRNNPKTILAVLGLVEQGMYLPHLLDAMTSGGVEADSVYHGVIDRAWEGILSEHDKAVLMAKAFFRHSVCDHYLGRIAGVDETCLREATKKLATISFFEFERTPQHILRIQTHPLAQDFALRIIREHPEFESEAEERWWNIYASGVIQEIEQAEYESLAELEDDVANVLEHLEKHIRESSPYCVQAAIMVATRGGLAHLLSSWGRYDDVLRMAELALEVGLSQQEPELIGECALHLMGPIHIKHHRFDEADRYIGLAIEQNTKLNDQWLAAMIDQTRSFLYLQRGYFGAAERFSQNALRIFLDLGYEYDIAQAYICLGGLAIDTGLKDLEDPIDTRGKTEKQLAKAETCYKQAEEYLEKEPVDWQIQRRMIVIRANRGTIARVRGDLDLARDLFQSCIGRTHSLFLDAGLYRELALVEHLAGNKDLAHSYEEKGLNLFRQIGMIETLCAEHSYRIIDRMKQEGTW